MSGYLERLGARALGLAQVAQPIVPPIFDPSLGLGPGAAGGMPVAAPEPAEPVAKPERAEPRYDRPTASAAAVPDPGPRSIELARRDARAPAAWESPRAALDEYEREHEHNGRAHDRGPWERAVETLPPAGREAAIVLAAPQEGVRPEAADERWPGPVPSVFSRVAPQLQQPLSTRENHPTMEGRRDPAAATQGAPVIRVTIGRIDVRADFPAPAPARAATTPPRAPMLSLEDYLKQRREGKR
jgi:hypothetical protein